MEGKTARGASSPANPALHIPDPLSTTSAAISSSMAQTAERTKKVQVSDPFPTSAAMSSLPVTRLQLE